MSFLRKLMGKAPDWAQFFSGGEFNAFLAALRRELDAMGVQYRLHPDAGVVQAVFPGDPNPHTLGLLNLAQVCRSAPRSGWPELIRKHLGVMASTGPRSSAIDNLGESFEAARELLKVRLYPMDFKAEVLASMASQRVADDFMAVLVYDFPDSIATVHPNHVEKWRVPMDDLVQTGLRNVWSLGRLSPERIDLGEEVWIDVYEDGDNYFAASHALMLHRYFDPEPELGLLVAVPQRHALVLRPLDGPAAIRSLHAMFYAVPQFYEEGPGSISPSAYWYRSGTFTRLPFERKGDDVSFYPPEVFTEVLERLGGG